MVKIMARPAVAAFDGFSATISTFDVPAVTPFVM
jgi:hypothetical protein